MGRSNARVSKHQIHRDTRLLTVFLRSMSYELLFHLRFVLWCATYLGLVAVGHVLLRKWRRKLLATMIINLAAFAGAVVASIWLVNAALETWTFGLTGSGFLLMWIILWAADIARVLITASGSGWSGSGWAIAIVAVLIAYGAARLTARDDHEDFEVAINAPAWDRALTADPATRPLAVALRQSIPAGYDAILYEIAKRRGKYDDRYKDELAYLTSKLLQDRTDLLAAAPDDRLVAIARQMARATLFELASSDCIHLSPSLARSADLARNREFNLLFALEVRAASDAFDHPVARDFVHPSPEFLADVDRTLPSVPTAALARAQRSLDQPGLPADQHCETIRDSASTIEKVAELSPSAAAYATAMTFAKQSALKQPVRR